MLSFPPAKPQHCTCGTGEYSSYQALRTIGPTCILQQRADDIYQIQLCEHLDKIASELQE